MQYHRALSSIRKWELSLGAHQSVPVWQRCVPGFCWPSHLCIHSEALLHALHRNLNRALLCLSFTPDLRQAQNTEWEVHFLSLLHSQLFVHYGCRQAGARVGSFWPYFSSGRSLQSCFSSLWLELIIAASPLQHEREESWRYLSVVIENKMRKHGKEDRIGFRGQRMLSE